ncbi:TlpA family protein disulfide reductase [Oleidesulfovibrio sp.]|uniref:TlpA family protein disulfide reductase n=1 Tax=Oleidesulfovibrio sp. TaxID=2909707 RepID=UPI003A88BB4C
MNKSRFSLIRLMVVLCVVLALPVLASAEGVKEGGSSTLLKAIAAENGKPVLVNFFASWCPPCKDEIPGIIAMRSKYSTDQVAIIGVSLDESRSALDNMINDLGINYPVIRGNQELARTFGITGIPRLLVYSAEGKLASDHIGYMAEDELQQLIEKNLVK